MFIHHTNLDDAGNDARKLVCYDCGVACDLGAMRTERLVYLSKLGAQSRRLPPPPVEKKVQKGKLAPTPFVQGEPRRYRFAYTKLGPSAFLSHLDVIRALPRAFRRNEIPLFYSAGFHPKPDMSFGPALSLGVFSLHEYVDMKITADLEPAEFLQVLSESAPDGLRFTGAVRLGPNDPSISRVIDTARYIIAIPRSVLAERGGEAWLEEQVKRVREATELKVLRKIEGIGKWVDVRSFIRTIEISNEAKESIAAAGMVGDLVPIVVDIEIRGSGSCKISEVVEVLASEPIEHRAIRVDMGTYKDGAVASPLDLDAVRKFPAPKVAAEITEEVATSSQ